MSSILICDDHPLVREGLRTIIEASFKTVTVLEAGSLAAAIAALEGRDDVEFVLLDYFVPGEHGFSHLTALRRRFPALPVIMVSAHQDQAVVDEAIRLGAAGFIPKSMGRELILAAIEQVLAGDLYVPPPELMQPVDMSSEADQAALARIEALTPQQLRVLEMVAEGKLNKQIAFALEITDSTVKAHVSAILDKLGLSTRTQAALFYRQPKS